MASQLISAPQAVFVLFICRMFSVVIYSPSTASVVESGAALYGNILAIALTLLALLPAFFLFRKDESADVIAGSFQLSGTFGKIVAGYYILLLLLILMSTAAQFEFFMTNAVFPRASSWFILLTLMLACTYAAYMGFEGVVRCGNIIVFFFLISIIFIIFSAKDKIDYANWTFYSHPSVNAVLLSALQNMARNVEFVLLILLFPRIKGGFRKISIWYLIFSTLILTVIGIITILVLGRFVAWQVFPFYSVASIAETKLIQRMDAIYMALWVLITFIRISLYLITAVQTCKWILPERAQKGALPVIALVTFLGGLWINRGMAAVEAVMRIIVTGIPVGIAVVLIPLIVLIGRKVRKR